MGNSSQLLQLAAFSAFSGGTMLYKALKNHKRVRRVADTPRSKVASAPQGLVELEGFAWPSGETFLTVNGEEAIYYVLELQREETTGSGKNRRKTWVTVFNIHHVYPFYLLDPTGIAQLHPHDSDLTLANQSILEFSNLSSQAKERAAEIVNGLVDNFPPRDGLWGMLTNSKYRLKESKVLVGSPLYAVGDFKTQSFNQITLDDSLSTFANKVIDFSSRSLKNVKHLLDKDKDGSICHREAIIGYTTAARLSRLSPSKETAPLEVFGTLSSSENHKLFFSDTHEHHLVNHLNKWQSLKIAGGAALIALSVCIGLLEFGVIQNPIDAAKKAQLERESHAKRELAAVESQIKVLHEACVNGQAGFCRQLLDRKHELGLSPQHIRYYEQMSK